MGMDQSLGFEPSRECVQSAIPEVRPMIINDVYRPESIQGKTFDLIVSFHVFDHLIDPVGLLESAVSKLRPGGHVLLVCHDAQALSAKILGSLSPIFDVEHIFLFSQQTIGRLLNKAGLDIVKIGSLNNRYPLGYWLRMAPIVNKWVGFLPKSLAEKAIALNAGNLFAIGRKRD
jgi:SAM-dependent methyltransferase